MVLFSKESFEQIISYNHPISALISSGVLSSDNTWPTAVEFTGFTSAFPRTAYLFGQLKPHTIEAPEVSQVPDPVEVPTETSKVPIDVVPDPVDEVVEPAPEEAPEPVDEATAPAEDVAEAPAEDVAEAPAEDVAEAPEPVDEATAE